MWALLAVMVFKVPPGDTDRLPPWWWVRQGFVLAVLLATYYFNVWVLMPRWLLRGRVALYAAGAAGLVLLVSIGSHSVTDRIFPRPDTDTRPAPGFWPGLGRGPRAQRQPPPDARAEPSLQGLRAPENRPPRPGGGGFDLILAMTTTLVMAAGAGVGVAAKWQLDTETRRRLEAEKATTELALLKAQINPHFFFNTLNNIYALTLLDADRARQALVQLSRLMRYVLYETDPGATRLSQELDFLRDYVELMQLRLPAATTVTFDVPGAPLAANPRFAPMLLLPFVENAFKHGISTESASQIRIRITQPAPDTVQLEVVNPRFPARAESLETSNGIGLANTRRRLELLYPGRYELEVSPPNAPPDTDFRVRLRVHA